MTATMTAEPTTTATQNLAAGALVLVRNDDGTECLVEITNIMLTKRGRIFLGKDICDGEVPTLPDADDEMLISNEQCNPHEVLFYEWEIVS